MKKMTRGEKTALSVAYVVGEGTRQAQGEKNHARLKNRMRRGVYRGRTAHNVNPQHSGLKS